MTSCEALRASPVKAAAAANPFDCLPNDIVNKILGLDERYRVFGYPDLRSSEELRRLRATCKLFRSLVSEAGILRWIFREDGSVARFNTFISRDLAASVRRLCLKVDEDYSLDLTSLLPSVLSQTVKTLESVTLIFNHRDRQSGELLESELSFEIFQSCTRLRRIFIKPGHHLASVGSWRVVAPPAKPLLELNTLIMANLCMSSSELQAMLSHFPVLKYLDVSFEKRDISLSSECVTVRSNTLKTLKWSEGEGTTRLDIICPRLTQLSIATEANCVSISCPLMENLHAYRLRLKVDVTFPMSFLRRLVFSRARWSTLSKILENAPNVDEMTIWGWHEETLQPLGTMGRLCPNLTLLQLLSFQAWTLLCSTATSNLKHEIKTEGLAFCSFAKLQHIDVFLRKSEENPSTRESIARLRVITAACKNLRGMDLYMLAKKDRQDEIEIGLQALSKENPSCAFVLHSGSKVILMVKAERVTHKSASATV